MAPTIFSLLRAAQPLDIPVRFGYDTAEEEGYLKGDLKVGNIKVNHEDLGKLCYFPLGRMGSYIEAKLVEVYFAGKTGDFIGVGEVEGNCIPVEANIENILVADEKD